MSGPTSKENPNHAPPLQSQPPNHPPESLITSSVSVTVDTPHPYSVTVSSSIQIGQITSVQFRPTMKRGQKGNTNTDDNTPLIQSAPYPLLYTSTGNEISVYDILTNQVIQRYSVLNDGTSIYGMKFNKNYDLLAVYGGNEFMILSLLGEDNHDNKDDNHVEEVINTSINHRSRSTTPFRTTASSSSSVSRFDASVIACEWLTSTSTTNQHDVPVNHDIDRKVETTGRVAIGCSDGSVHVYSVQYNTCTHNVTLHHLSTYRCNDNTTLYSMKIRDLSHCTDGRKRNIETAMAVMNGTVFGELIVWYICDESECMTLVDMTPTASHNVNPRYRLIGHDGVIFHIDATVEGSTLHICSASDDRSVRVWDVDIDINDKCSTNASDGSSNSGNDASPLTSASSTLASVGTIEAQHTLYGHTARVFRCAFVSHNNVGYIISCGEDNTAFLWEDQSGNQVASLKDMAGCIWSCELNALGLVAFGCGNGAVRLRSIESLLQQTPSPSLSSRTRQINLAKYGAIRMIQCAEPDTAYAVTNNYTVVKIDINSGDGHPAVVYTHPYSINITSIAVVKVGRDMDPCLFVGDQRGNLFMKAIHSDKGDPVIPVTNENADVTLCHHSSIMYIHVTSIDVYQLLLTADATGNMVIWRIEYNKAAAHTAKSQRYADSWKITAAQHFRLPVKARVTSVDTQRCAIMNGATAMVVGDSRGSMYLYTLHLNDNLLSVVAHFRYENIHKTEHIDRVKFLNDRRHVHIVSCARDGKAIWYRQEYRKKGVNGDPPFSPSDLWTKKQNADEFSQSVQQECGMVLQEVESFSTDHIAAIEDLLVENKADNHRSLSLVGFKADEFVIWSSEEYETTRVVCGGGKRAHSFMYSQQSNYSYYVYAHDSTLYTHTIQPASHPYQLGINYDADQSNAIAAIPTSNSAEGDITSYFVTACEDGHCKVFSHASVNGITEAKCIATLKHHTQAVKRLYLYPFNGSRQILFSGGSQDQLYATLIDSTHLPDALDMITSVHELTSTNGASKKQSQDDIETRILCMVAFKPSASISLSALPSASKSSAYTDPFICLVTGDSRGVLSLYKLHHLSPPLRLRLCTEADAVYPILSIAHIEVDHRDLVFAGTTDGEVLLYEITGVDTDQSIAPLSPSTQLQATLIHRQHIHEAGVNVIVMQQSQKQKQEQYPSPQIVTATAGDDQCINVVTMNVSALHRWSIYRKVNAHNSCIRSLSLVNTRIHELLISTAYDQRVKVWELDEGGTHGDKDRHRMGLLTSKEVALADIQSASIIESGDQHALLAVVGQGLQILHISHSDNGT